MKINLFIIFFYLIFNISNVVYSVDIFNFEFTKIEFKSNDIEKTKNETISELKTKNLLLLFKQILTDKEFKKIRNKINHKFSDNFIRNIIIENEKIINNNYSANLKIIYNENLIIKFLRNHKLSYAYFLPDNFFLIISEDTGINKYLFSKKNSYYKFIMNSKNYLDFYKIPNLDINDRYLLNSSDIQNRNIDNINKFIKKYNYSNNIIIESKYNFTSYDIDIYLFIENEYILVKNYSLSQLEHPKFFLNLKSNILDTWKYYNNVQNNKLNNIECYVNSLNINELKQIKLLIKNISVIKDFELKKISLYKNFYIINYYGNYEILKKLFYINSINIKFDDNYCNIFLK